MHKITFRRRGDKALFLEKYCEKHCHKCAYYRTLMCERQFTSTSGTRDIQCPFFLQHNELEICCEGIMDKCMHKITFRRRGDKPLFLENYCEKHYDKCEYYRMLMCEKYEEEYKDK